MPPYDQLQIEYLILALLGGVLLTGLVFLALRGRQMTFTFKRKTEQEYEDEVHQFGEVREGHRPMPVFLIVLLTLFIAWAIGYTIYSGSNYPY